MKKGKIIIKFLVVTTVFALCVTTFTQTTGYNVDVQASTLSDLQQKKKENDAKLAQINKQIAATKNDQKKEKEYQQNISSQIEVTEDNIRLILDYTLSLHDALLI